MDIVSGSKEHVLEITDIFNYYIANTNARFETEPMTAEDRFNWFAQFKPETAHQLFVAIEDGKVIGFACSQPYRSSYAFADTVEVTIYLANEGKGRGAGSALYERLFVALGSQNVHRALSGIALPNEASLELHKKFGFQEVGVFNEYAKKNGQYISSIWLAKCFASSTAIQQDVKYPRRAY